MEYDRGGSFPFDFDWNRIPFSSISKENCHNDQIPFNLNGNSNFNIEQPVRVLEQIINKL